MVKFELRLPLNSNLILAIDASRLRSQILVLTHTIIQARAPAQINGPEQLNNP
jgi:hypothetical protein